MVWKGTGTGTLYSIRFLVARVFLYVLVTVLDGGGFFADDFCLALRCVALRSQGVPRSYGDETVRCVPYVYVGWSVPNSKNTKSVGSSTALICFLIIEKVCILFVVRDLQWFGNIPWNKVIVRMVLVLVLVLVPIP